MSCIPEVHGASQEGIVESFRDHNSWAGYFTRLLCDVQEISRCSAQSVVHNDLVAGAITHVPPFLPHKVILFFEYPATRTWKKYIHHHAMREREVQHN